MNCVYNEISPECHPFYIQLFLSLELNFYKSKNKIYFNENSKVYVDIAVDAAGNVTSVSLAKGTTTTNPTNLSIALQKAKQLKFNPGEEDRGTIIVNLKVQD